MTDDMLGLLDSLSMVRTFRIHQPNDDHVLIEALQYNDDESDAKFTDTPFDCIFEMNDNRVFHWEFNPFFSGWHYEAVFFKHDKISPLFSISTPLPDVLYKMMRLKKGDMGIKYSRCSIKQTRRHIFENRKEMSLG